MFILYVHIDGVLCVLFSNTDSTNTADFPVDWTFPRVYWAKWVFHGWHFVRNLVSVFHVFSVLGVCATIIYDEWIAKIEQTCEKIYFIMVKVSLFTLLGFPLLQTMSNYLIDDLKEESYLLPTPATYVFAINLSGKTDLLIRIFSILFLKTTIRLAYTDWIFSGFDHRSNGHHLHTAFSDYDHELISWVVHAIYRISWRC